MVRIGKPEPAPKVNKDQRLRARARSGDVGAKLELLFSWIGGVLSGKEKATFAQLLLLGAAAAGVGAVGYGAHVLTRSNVVTIAPTDAGMLRTVFFSGEPWLVECTSARKASPVLYESEGSLKGIRLATLDCDAVLPSGKTTYQRFKLSPPSSGAVVLAASNSERPQIAPRNALASGAALASWARGATKSKVYSPATSEQFESQCLRKPWCVLVLSAGSRLVDAERATLAKLAAAERRARVVKVDTSKLNLMLDLPNGTPQPSAAQSVVLMLKQMPAAVGADAKAAEADAAAAADGAEDADAGDAGDAKPAGGAPVAALLLGGGLRDGKGTAAAVRAAVGDAAELPAGFSTLLKRPSLRPKRVAPKPSAKTSSADYSRRPSEPESKTFTDAELKSMREEAAKNLEKRKQEAEQTRREEMAAEEASASNIVEEAATEEVGGSVLEEEGDDDDGAAADDEVEAEEFD